MKENVSKIQWTTLMDLCMKKLHEEGHSRQKLVSVLSQIQLDPLMKSALSQCHASGSIFYILSDANQVFIETILEANECSQYFQRVLTNPGFFDETGRLNIKPYQDFLVNPHGCPLCPLNMCKGSILLSQILSNHPSRGPVAYIGDGRGDFCPCAALSGEDHVLARKDYPLHKLILASFHENSPSTHQEQEHGVYNYEDQSKCFGRKIQAKVHVWETPADVHRILTSLFSAS
eukprot:TRINITY_DN4292_c0_g1_i3.p1 TRINITY_DN4292_c0_g1~~TRINITY_DN4292_c0_g1_i3.p1  ORF type:complete len:232 (+),score=40.69 TRINITY_DN4292_c0_g1_i3:221-916(+)